MEKTIAFVCFFLIITSTFRASSQSNIHAAFQTSYETEYSGEYGKAISALKAVYDEKSYELNLRLGWLYYLAGNFKESVAHYNKANSIMPYAIEPKFGIVYPYSSMGNWDQVIAVYKDILKTDPQNTTVNYRMGNLYFGRLEYNEAQKYFEKVANLYPFDYDSVIMLAWTYFYQGKSKEARALFEKCLMIRPGDSSASEGLTMLKN